MSEHAGYRAAHTPGAGWFQVVGAAQGIRRWWDGAEWGVMEADYLAELEAAKQGEIAPSTTAGAPPAGWLQDPDDATMLRWWDGSAWADFRKPAGT